MKNLNDLEKRLNALTEEYNEFYRVNVRRKGPFTYFNKGAVNKLNQLRRNIENTKININQLKMRSFNH